MICIYCYDIALNTNDFKLYFRTIILFVGNKTT